MVVKLVVNCQKLLDPYPGLEASKRPKGAKVDSPLDLPKVLKGVLFLKEIPVNHDRPL